MRGGEVSFGKRRQRLEKYSASATGASRPWSRKIRQSGVFFAATPAASCFSAAQDSAGTDRVRAIGLPAIRPPFRRLRPGGCHALDLPVNTAERLIDITVQRAFLVAQYLVLMQQNAICASATLRVDPAARRQRVGSSGRELLRNSPSRTSSSFSASPNSPAACHRCREKSHRTRNHEVVDTTGKLPYEDDIATLKRVESLLGARRRGATCAACLDCRRPAFPSENGGQVNRDTCAREVLIGNPSRAIYTIGADQAGIVVSRKLTCGPTAWVSIRSGNTNAAGHGLAPSARSARFDSVPVQYRGHCPPVVSISASRLLGGTVTIAHLR